VKKTFPKEDILAKKLKRLNELEYRLKLDEQTNVVKPENTLVNDKNISKLAEKATERLANQHPSIKPSGTEITL
ncbi:hypothetical protein, partial [Serratia marcescens]|uniref:hypothetical protein n=1 Tax=Serratia marcescens TaxID=615 RepID=UPI001652BD0E